MHMHIRIIGGSVVTWVYIVRYVYVVFHGLGGLGIEGGSRGGDHSNYRCIWCIYGDKMYRVEM
jgi:hypothetical protein